MLGSEDNMWENGRVKGSRLAPVNEVWPLRGIMTAHNWGVQEATSRVSKLLMHQFVQLPTLQPTQLAC